MLMRQRRRQPSEAVGAERYLHPRGDQQHPVLPLDPFRTVVRRPSGADVASRSASRPAPHPINRNRPVGRFDKTAPIARIPEARSAGLVPADDSRLVNLALVVREPLDSAASEGQRC